MKSTLKGLQQLFSKKSLAIALTGFFSLSALPGAGSANSRPRTFAGSAASTTSRANSGLTSADLTKSGAAKPDQATEKQILAAYGKLPLNFEQNLGQTDAQVKFLARGNGYNLFLTATETVLVLSKDHAAKTMAQASQAAQTAQPGRTKLNAKAFAAINEPTVLRVAFAGANPDAQVEGQQLTEHKSNYLRGNEADKWRMDIPNYARVSYQNLYPGIDVVYYGNQGNLEYDFIVAPHADANAIALNFSGADRLSIDQEGDLILHVGESEIRQHRPTIYQTRNGKKTIVNGRYFLKGDSSVGFQLADYDRDLALVIDPVISYSTYLGGSGTGNGTDQANSIAIDALGNAYITGFSFSSDFPVSRNLQPLRGNADIFITKLGQNGNVLSYSTYLGGTNLDVGSGISVDAGGNAYIVGLTSSTDFPTASPLQSSLNGFVNAFVTKLSAAGNVLVYSTYLGGNNLDFANSVAVDASGNAFVTGGTSSSNFPTVTPFQSTLLGSQNAFISKLNSSGSALTYSTYLGGGNFDEASDIALDSSGNAVVTGLTASTDFPTQSPFQLNIRGPQNAFITKLSANGSALSYSSFLGGNGFDAAGGIALDGSDNIYLTGITSSTNFPTQSPFQASLKGTEDAFVSKLNAAGSALAYSTYLGGTGSDSGGEIAVDTAGNAYVTGGTSSTNFPTKNALQLSNGGSQDAFITKLTPAGNALSYSSYLGGSNSDQGNAVAVDANGNAYLAGMTASVDFLTTNPAQATFRGLIDAFVTKLDSTGTAPVYSTFLGGSSGNDSGNGIAIDRTGNVYITGVTDSPDFPTSFPMQATNRGEQDVLVAKLNAAGNALLFSTYLGGSFSDISTGIALDSAGNAYVTGYTDSSNYPTTNTIQKINKGATDLFVTKLSATNGALSYSTYLGGVNFEQALAIAVDPAGNAFITGVTSSDDFPTLNPIQPNLLGLQDAFIVELNPTATALLYSTYYGGTGDNDLGRSIAIDAVDNAYVVGETDSSDFPVKSTLQQFNRGFSDGFIVKIGTLGKSVLYSSYLGGSDNDRVNDVVVDGSGNAYVVGQTDSTDFPTANPVASGGRGLTDGFIAKINATGSGLIYSKYFGGSDIDRVTGVALDSIGNVYVAGETFSVDFPTVLPIQQSNAGNGDAFAAKLNNAGTVTFFSYLGGSDADAANGIAIDPSNNLYILGQTTSVNFPVRGAIQGVNRGAVDLFVTKINLTTAPTGITTFSPLTATTGASVSITGTGFLETTSVQFNGAEAIFRVVSNTSIVATVPVDATNGKITVFSPTGTAVSKTDFKVAPKVAGFTPGSGVPGDVVTITGTSLSNPTFVRIGTTNATILSSSPTQIQITVPAAAVSGKIMVITPNGTSTSTALFTIIKPPTISSFTPASGRAGTVVSISGLNLSSATDVKFGVVPGSNPGISITSPITVSSTNVIKVVVPVGAQTGRITVTNRAGTATSLTNFTVLP